MTNMILRGKPDVENPHVRFDGEVASEKPRRGSLHCNRNVFKRMALFVVAVGMMFCGFAADPAPGICWNVRAGEGTSPANPANWLDGDNWEGGIAPNAAGAIADFRLVGSGDDIWIKIPEGLTVTVGIVYMQGGTRTVHLMDGGTLNLACTGSVTPTIRQYGTESPVTFVSHTTVTATSMPDLFDADIRGPVVCGATLQSRYSTHFYPNYFAESAASSRSVVSASGFQTVGAPTFHAAVSEGAMGTWEFANGSRLMHRIDGAGGLSLVAGQLLHADGFVKDGAFVKRIYTGDYIEMSEPALDTEAASVTFDAFSPQLVQDFGTLTILGDDTSISLTRPSSEQDVCVDVDKLVGSYNFSLQYAGHVYYGPDGTVDAIPGPGCLRIHDATGFRGKLVFRSGHFAFAGTDQKKSMEVGGFLFYSPGNYDKYCQGWVTVEDGVDVSFKTVSGWGGLVIKDGPGTMKVSSPLATHGKLRVTEGEFILETTAEGSVPTLAEIDLRGGSFALADGSALKPAKVTVKAGAALVVSDGLDLTGVTLVAGSIVRLPKDYELDASGLSVPDGVVFDGPGVVRGLANPKAVVLTGGCAVALSGSADNINLGALPEGLPTRVQPAVWFSAKDKDSLGYKSGSTSEIETWYDCRGKGDAYVRASVTGSVYPKINAGAIKIARNQSSGVTIQQTGALKWSRIITGIRAVFQLTRSDDMTNSGFLLGGAEVSNPFVRQSNRYYTERFSSTASDLVKTAPYFINGRTVSSIVAWNESDAWQAYSKPFQTAYKTLQLVESHPFAPGVAADCLGWQGGAFNGYSVGEVLVYTNELTEIERKQVENYVLKKWFGIGLRETEVIPESQHFNAASAGSAMLIEAGDRICVDGLSGTGAFSKKGSGDLVFQGLRNPDGDLVVSGGSVTIRGADVDIETLTKGAALHLDATKDDSFPDAKAGDSFPYDGAQEGAQLVASWLDAAGRDCSARIPPKSETSSSATKLPTRRTVLPAESGFAKPMKIVDYGPSQRKDAGWLPWGDCCLHTIRDGAGVEQKPLVGIKAAFSVWGSKYGGSMMLGDYLCTNARPPLRDDPADATCAILKLDKSTVSIRPTLGQDGLWLKNGAVVDPDRTGLSGSFDVVSAMAFSANSNEGLNCSALAFHSHDNSAANINRLWAGGLQLGELILLTNDVTKSDYEAIDAYLNNKWFGRPYPAKFASSRVRALAVAEGATVNVEGDKPLICSVLSGAGTVNGALALAAEATFEVPVNSDGTVAQTLTVSGEVDLSQGGTVLLTGDVAKLAQGTYKLLSATGVGSVDNWTVGGYTGRKTLTLKVRVDGLYLNVTGQGLCIIVR